jgi:hypothetical protein
MRRFPKVVAGSALALALAVPAGVALADDPPTTAEPSTTQVCTDEERAERWAARDQLRAEITTQLQEEGVTDPVELREELRTRVQVAMEEQFGELPGPLAGGGLGGHRSGPQDGTGPQADRPLDGSGNRWGANR